MPPQAREDLWIARDNLEKLLDIAARLYIAGRNLETRPINRFAISRIVRNIFNELDDVLTEVLNENNGQLEVVIHN